MTDSYLRTLKRLAINRVTLPYRRISVRGGIRHHVHEYPKVPGGLVEKLGRKLYTIRIDLAIDEEIARSGYYQGRNLITNLKVLMHDVFEGQVTTPVYLPNIGEIRAVATEWERDLDVKLLSGEASSVTMLEDNDSASLVENTLKVAPPAAITQYLGDVVALSPTPKPNLLEQLHEAVNNLLAYRDQTQMWAGFLAAKIEGLQYLFEEIDSSLDDLKNPESWELLEALRNLWGAVKDLGEEVGVLNQFSTYTTPRIMSASEISLAIFNDTAHAIDVMKLNAITDPYAVEAGTSIRYFTAEAA
jgi:hypothetical protein